MHIWKKMLLINGAGVFTLVYFLFDWCKRNETKRLRNFFSTFFVFFNFHFACVRACVHGCDREWCMFVYETKERNAVWKRHKLSLKLVAHIIKSTLSDINWKLSYFLKLQNIYVYTLVKVAWNITVVPSSDICFYYPK